MCSCLEYLHSFEVYYPNLKPESFGLDKTGKKIKLLNIYQSIKFKSTSSIIGFNFEKIVNHYSEPENFNNKSIEDVKSNIWSLGIILLEMCFGHIPFKVHQYVNIDGELIKSTFIKKCYSLQLIDFIYCCLVSKLSSKDLLGHPFLSFIDECDSGVIVKEEKSLNKENKKINKIPLELLSHILLFEVSNAFIKKKDFEARETALEFYKSHVHRAKKTIKKRNRKFKYRRILESKSFLSHARVVDFSSKP